MSMRSYGEIEGIGFRRIGFDIYTNGIKYKLIGYNENIIVSVNTMTELKEEIRKLNQESQYANNSEYKAYS